MITIESTKTISQTPRRIKLIPLFSERQLLLLLGDMLVMLFAGGVAFWLLWVMR